MLGVLRKCLPTLGSLQHLLGVCVCGGGGAGGPQAVLSDGDCRLMPSVPAASVVLG